MLTDIVKRCEIGDGVSEYDSDGTLVVCLIDVLEAFLTSSVPNLQLDTLIVHLYGFDLEINANRGDMTGFELVIAEPQQYIGLSDAGIANYDQLDGAAVLLLFLLRSFHYYYLNSRTDSFVPESHLCILLTHQNMLPQEPHHGVPGSPSELKQEVIGAWR